MTQVTRFRDIPPYTKSPPYTVNVGLGYLVAHYTMCVTEWGLDVSPDFQRAYVWTANQKVSFVEYFLRGGSSGVDIYTNCPTWNSMVPPLDPKSWFVLVDGKQRLDALLGFLNNEFQVFGGSYFRDSPMMRQVDHTTGKIIYRRDSITEKLIANRVNQAVTNAWKGVAPIKESPRILH